MESALVGSGVGVLSKKVGKASVVCFVVCLLEPGMYGSIVGVDAVVGQIPGGRIGKAMSAVALGDLEGEGLELVGNSGGRITGMCMSSGI